MGTVQLSPPAAPFQKINNPGESITIKTAGKVLVIPTGDSVKLPSFNEYALNSNRLTVAESPFGGLKGSGSPDYAVGTIYTPTDGVYITDTSGTNSTKTMTAGKLKELNLLTVNNTLKTITEEFVVCNTNLNNGGETIISDGSSTSGWGTSTGTLTSLTSENGRLKMVGKGNDATGFKIVKSNLNLTGKQFLKFDIECSVNKNLYVLIGKVSPSNNFKYWRSTRFPITANTNTRFVLPLSAPQGTTGQNPSNVTGTLDLSNCDLYIGTDASDASDITIYLDNISADMGKDVYVEIDIPDNLNADSSLTLQCWDGSAYQLCGNYKLDSSYVYVSGTAANWKLNDTTKLDDVYGSFFFFRTAS